MAELYLAGATSQQVADIFHTDKGTVCRHLEKAGVVRRTNGETKRKYFIRQDAFATVQDEATAYWLGFLFADGCVWERRNGGNKGLNVILQEQDISHVQKLATFLGGNLPIKKEKRYATWGIHVHSVQLVNDLIRLGCLPNKSAASVSLEFPSLPTALMVHFVRGYFDGDGSAFEVAGIPTLSFCGPLAFLSDMARWIAKEPGEQGSIFNHYTSAHVRYLIYRGGYKANIVGQWLYQDATLYFERKRHKIETFSYPKKKRACVKPAWAI